MDFYIVLGILGLSLFLFIQNKLRADFVSLLTLALLLIFGFVDEKQAFSGFANPVVITIGCMLILSKSLEATGAISYIVFKIKPYVGNSLTGVLLFFVIICGILSAFINNTAAVAIMIPIVIAISKEKNFKKEQLLIPLSFAAQFGGMCTLIGTSSNLLANQLLLDNKLEGFNMFSFSHIGLIFFIVGIIYLVFASNFVLNKISTSKDSEVYDLKNYLIELKVLENSKLINSKLNSNKLNDIKGVRIIQMLRGNDDEEEIFWGTEETLLQANDKLILRADVSKVMDVLSSLGLEVYSRDKISLEHHNLKLFEVNIANQSDLVNKKLSQMNMLARNKVAVLGIKRRGEILKGRISNNILKAGDTMLLQGARENILDLAEKRSLLTLNELTEIYYNKEKMLASVLVMVSVIFVASINAMPIAAVSFLGVIVLIMIKAVRLSQVYKSVDVKILMLIACFLPFSQVLIDQGIIASLSSYLGSFSEGNLYVLYAMIYVISVGLTAFMSNAVCVMLMAPVAISVAVNLSINYQLLVLIIMFASSGCYLTPIGYQTNLMVMGAGNYKYADFLKVGILLNLMFMLLCVFVVPLFF